MKKLMYWLAILLVVIWISGCGIKQNSIKNDEKISEKNTLITSIPPIANIAEHIAGDKFQVYSIVKENSSPEEYEISTQDLKKLADAQAYLVNGEFMFEQQYLKTIKEKYPDLDIVKISEGIELLKIEEDEHEHHEEIILSAFWTEPFWHLEVKDGKLHYETPENKREAIDIQIDKTEENLTINWTTAKVIFIKKECIDDSKWDTHTYRVQVDFPGIQVFGCGDMLDKWKYKNFIKHIDSSSHSKWYDEYEEEHEHNNSHPREGGDLEHEDRFLPSQEWHDSKHHHHHGEFDPHYWLSVENIQIIANNITHYLSSKDPENSEYYANNLQSFIEEVEALQFKKLPTHSHMYIYHPSIRYFAHELGAEVIAFQQHGKDTTSATIEKVLEDFDIDHDFVLVDQQAPQGFIDYLENKDIKIKRFNPIKKDILENLKTLYSFLWTSLHHEEHEHEHENEHHEEEHEHHHGE